MTEADGMRCCSRLAACIRRVLSLDNGRPGSVDLGADQASSLRLVADHSGQELPSMSSSFSTERSETAEYNKLVVFASKVAEVSQRGKGFVCGRGTHGFHILFDESEMLPYFDMIRKDVPNGKNGRSLRRSLQTGIITANSSNKQIWNALVRSSQFSGLDFEHRYKILPSAETDEVGPQSSVSLWDYSFAESVVLGHTILLVPVMQYYGPLMPKLDLNGPTRKFEQAQPLLAVGMIGDCVKGQFFNDLKRKADEGDAMAQMQTATLLNPERLQQKIHALVRGLLLARDECGVPGLLLDATLVGSGAFGGSTKVLAQPFADSLNGGDLPWDNTKDEVNFYIFPPPKPDEFTLEHLKYKVTLNNEKGLGAACETADDRVRVVVAGFDPVSLAPHGVLNRAFSAEGQLCHTTDFLYRTTCIEGRFARVQVPEGMAWESPAAFFARPQQLKYKVDKAYNTVRFVPKVVLKALGWWRGRRMTLSCMQQNGCHLEYGTVMPLMVGHSAFMVLLGRRGDKFCIPSGCKHYGDVYVICSEDTCSVDFVYRNSKV